MPVCWWRLLHQPFSTAASLRPSCYISDWYNDTASRLQPCRFVHLPGTCEWCFRVRPLSSVQQTDTYIFNAGYRLTVNGIVVIDVQGEALCNCLSASRGPFAAASNGSILLSSTAAPLGQEWLLTFCFPIWHLQRLRTALHMMAACHLQSGAMMQCLLSLITSMAWATPV